jgi:DNA-binding CsgD family transcriptional regulator
MCNCKNAKIGDKVSGNIIDELNINMDFINQLPGLFAVADLDSKFIVGNHLMLDWGGFKSHDAMIGKTYCDVPCKVSEEHEDFIFQDNAVLKNNGYGQLFGLFCYNNNEWRVVFYEKYPLKNKKNEIMGLATYVTDVTQSKMIDINKFVTLTNYKDSVKLCKKQKGYLINNDPENISLSTRELECLFFLLRGKTSKEVSSILKISHRTIEIYTEQLKLKFNVKSKSELIEKAMLLGYMNTLPNTVIDLLK